MMTMEESIRDRINRLKEWAEAEGRMDSGVKKAIDNAEKWLADGAVCRYSNQDCDILQSLIVFTKSAN